MVRLCQVYNPVKLSVIRQDMEALNRLVPRYESLHRYFRTQGLSDLADDCQELLNHLELTVGEFEQILERSQ